MNQIGTRRPDHFYHLPDSTITGMWDSGGLGLLHQLLRRDFWRCNRPFDAVSGRHGQVCTHGFNAKEPLKAALLQNSRLVRLALGELLAPTRLVKTDLLALDFPRVPGH